MSTGPDWTSESWEGHRDTGYDEGARTDQADPPALAGPPPRPAVPSSYTDDDWSAPVDGEGRRFPVRAALVLVGAMLIAGLAVVAVLLATGVAERPEQLSAEDVATRMQQRIGLPGVVVRCPGPLPKELGARATCTATRNGATRTYTGTVTYVDAPDVLIEIGRG